MSHTLIHLRTGSWGILFCLASLFGSRLAAQAPPLPIEVLLGHEQLYFQMVVKRPLVPQSRVHFFSVATYAASYGPDQSENSITIPAQISYTLGRGFGVMAGADINSVAGFAPIVGPQHNYASRTFLAVTVASFFLHTDRDLKLFGLYEYKPPLGSKWTLYTRLQFIYNASLRDGTHNRSYLYLRAGLKRGPLIFGLGTNWDQKGPDRLFQQNYGLFGRWELR